MGLLLEGSKANYIAFEDVVYELALVSLLGQHVDRSMQLVG